MSYLGISSSGEFLYSTNDDRVYRFGEIAGDVTGLIHDVTVSGIAGYPIEAAAPTDGTVLEYDSGVWSFIATPTGGSAHNFLSGTHEDVVASTPTRGGIVVANSTPEWEQMPLGLDGEVLYSNGSDIVYTILGASTPFDQGAVGTPSVAFSGDPDTGLYLSGTNSIGFAGGGALIAEVDGVNSGLQLYGGLYLNQTEIGSNTTIGTDDCFCWVTAGGVTVTLPPSPATAQMVIVKDSAGNADDSSNAITIAGNGNNIDGNASISIRNAYGSFTLMFTGSVWNVV